MRYEPKTLVCNANPGIPSVELCDALDNDCDGTSDENNPEGGMSCTVPGQNGTLCLWGNALPERRAPRLSINLPTGKQSCCRDL